jgi:hypothetical protein
LGAAAAFRCGPSPPVRVVAAPWREADEAHLDVRGCPWHQHKRRRIVVVVGHIAQIRGCRGRRVPAASMALEVVDVAVAVAIV